MELKWYLDLSPESRFEGLDAFSSNINIPPFHGA
jgi:hypothetical protein